VPDAVRSSLERDPLYRFVPERHVVEIGDGEVRDHRGDRHGGDVVIVCPGAAHGLSGWEPGRAAFRRVRLQMLETEPWDRVVTTSIADGDSLRYYPAFEVPARELLPDQPPLVAQYRIQLLLQQRLDGSLTIGDTHETDEPFPVSVSDPPYAHLLGRAESILGGPLPPVRRRWAGIYLQSVDEGLYHRERIGESTWVVTGAGGRGMTLAPAIAEDVWHAVGTHEPAAVGASC
jgi:glycine/D-amino acid oxidase-like deaminating enzyme